MHRTARLYRRFGYDRTGRKEIGHRRSAALWAGLWVLALAGGVALAMTSSPAAAVDAPSGGYGAAGIAAARTTSAGQPEPGTGSTDDPSGGGNATTPAAGPTNPPQNTDPPPEPPSDPDPGDSPGQPSDPTEPDDEATDEDSASPGGPGAEDGDEESEAPHSDRGKANPERDSSGARHDEGRTATDGRSSRPGAGSDASRDEAPPTSLDRAPSPGSQPRPEDPTALGVAARAGEPVEEAGWLDSLTTPQAGFRLAVGSAVVLLAALSGLVTAIVRRRRW